MKTWIMALLATAALNGVEARTLQRPPPPPDGFGGGERSEPPDGFGGNKMGPPPDGFGGSKMGPPPDGFGGGMGHGGPRPPRGAGGMRDDPSDPSRYAGVETVDAQSKTFVGKSFRSKEENKSPLYVKNGGQAFVTNATFMSSVANANAVLAIGKGSRAVIVHAAISTTADSSRGLYAFQGGEIEATDVKISTKGAHCAAMATDRGRGKVTVDGGVLNTAGDGSPCIYATGELKAANVTGEATGSEALVIEGRNSIDLRDAKLVGHRKCGAMIYQSFSGDAETGVGRLTMERCSLTARTGPLFFITNTRAEINLSNCQLKNEGNGPLVKLGPSRWGRDGTNGGTLVLTASNQVLQGEIEVSEISAFKMVLESGAVFRGRVNRTGKGKKVEIVVKKGATLDLSQDSIAHVVRE